MLALVAMLRTTKVVLVDSRVIYYKNVLLFFSFYSIVKSYLFYLV